MTVRGASFLLERCGSVSVHTPEELSSEQRELARLAVQFMENDVVPRTDEIEGQNPLLVSQLLKKAGELGLLMAEVPTDFGGLSLGKIDSTVIAEYATHLGSFVVAMMCHTGIGTLPILYYGTPEQKAKYLPKLATGELLGAYALTEPGSGSDALAARTKAVLSKDKKHYLLSGEKIYITNGGFADLFTVFAKVDGEHFTAFLVERSTPGLSTGPEEKKMGIHGSSTTPVILNEAKVPVENVLGQIGKGHKIAFNILNVGRWKLGAACVGSSKRLMEMVVPYALERHQFGVPIATFGMMREKLAEMAMRTFMTESIVYRYAGMLDDAAAELDSTSPDYYKQYLDVIDEYQIEASIAKVYGSEALQFVADESVQILGGYGFVKEYKVERFYRDCRVNRIFEGTNEINRMIIPGTVFKRAIAGKLDFMTEIQAVLGELKKGFPTVGEKEPMAAWRNQLIQLKKLMIYLGGVAIQTYGPNIQNEQLILKGLADVAIESFAIDSGMARLLTLKSSSHAYASMAETMVTTYMAEKIPHLKALARQLVVNMAGDDTTKQASYLKAIDRFLPFLPMNTQTAKMTIADWVVETYR